MAKRSVGRALEEAHIFPWCGSLVVAHIRRILCTQLCFNVGSNGHVMHVLKCLCVVSFCSCKVAWTKVTTLAFEPKLLLRRVIPDGQITTKNKRIAGVLLHGCLWMMVQMWSPIMKPEYFLLQLLSASASLGSCDDVFTVCISLLRFRLFLAHIGLIKLEEELPLLGTVAQIVNVLVYWWCVGLTCPLLLASNLVSSPNIKHKIKCTFRNSRWGGGAVHASYVVYRILTCMKIEMQTSCTICWLSVS